MRLNIGRLKNGPDVSIADTSPNQHIFISGMSGSGKSTRIKEILLSSFEMGDTVIVFDIGGMDYYPPRAFQGLDNTCINRISAIHDGIDLHILDDASFDTKAGYVNFVSYIVDIISGTLRFGTQQRGALIQAVAYAVEHKSEHPSEMDAIIKGLKMQDTPVSKSVYNKLWQILKSDILRDDGKDIEKGKINVISFQDINPSTQKNLIEIVLASIWRTLRSGGADMGDITLIIDEFQNLSLKQDSTLFEMLRESRKYGVNLILSTQTVAAFKKEVMASITQTAVQLYFQPTVSDIDKIAAIIDPDYAKKWVDTLRGLRIGESVTLGNISIREKEFKDPLIIQSHYTKDR